MKITKAALGKLTGEYSNYLLGPSLTRFFADFDIRFAAGHWAAGGFSDRFAQGGYDPRIDESIVAQTGGGRTDNPTMK